MWNFNFRTLIAFATGRSLRRTTGRCAALAIGRSRSELVTDPLCSFPLNLHFALPPSQRGRCFPFPTSGRLPVAFRSARIDI
jgi:hypothetical protein